MGWSVAHRRATIAHTRAEAHRRSLALTDLVFPLILEGIDLHMKKIRTKNKDEIRLIKVSPYLGQTNKDWSQSP